MQSPKRVVIVDGDDDVRRALTELGYDVRAVPRRLTGFPTIAAGLAHEITNPLAVIVTNATIISEDLETLRDRFEPGSALRADVELLAEAHADVAAAALRIQAVVDTLRAAG